jgi:hypothetical protein
MYPARVKNHMPQVREQQHIENPILDCFQMLGVVGSDGR